MLQWLARSNQLPALDVTNLSPSNLPQPSAPQLALADLIAATSIFAASLTVVCGPSLNRRPPRLDSALEQFWVIALLWTLPWLLWMHRRHVGQLVPGAVCGAALSGLGLELILCSGSAVAAREPFGFFVGSMTACCLSRMGMTMFAAGPWVLGLLCAVTVCSSLLAVLWWFL